MLVLLPPSETKRPGGVGVSIDKAAIIWAALDPARDVAINALVQLCQDEEAAAKSLKLGKTNRKDIQANLEIMTSPTMPALQRYTGVLYDALGYDELSRDRASASRKSDVHTVFFVWASSGYGTDSLLSAFRRLFASWGFSFQTVGGCP